MITNLDQLNTQDAKVVFLGKEYNIAYIPSGISLDVLNKFNQFVELGKTGRPSEEVLQKKIELVATFTSAYFPEIDTGYIEKHSYVWQLNSFCELLMKAIIEEGQLTQSDVEQKLSKKKLPVGKP